MSLLGNIIWFVFGGVFIAIEYLLASVAMMLTVVGIPFGLQSIKLTELALFPFGKEVRKRETDHGCLWTIMNIVWFFVGESGSGFPILVLASFFVLL
ncbi:YccF domain-containing protein [Persicobacter sp. CCB-QB2]|uniref:YccF domain-containing protein n=1 Tax=Persicobacter sp. CCB-QB2 TaxID=1561025 RepID=UPI000A4BF4DC|nr:YccF domain-containing protein [Persicobacter sp. CCB-QB2]